MSRVRGKNTKPEIHLRRALYALGVRFRVHDRTVPGTPDISHKAGKVAVFVDGCFWHGCPEHYSRPQSHQGYWDGRLTYNRDLRRRVLVRLEEDGWLVIQSWECAIHGDATEVALQIARAVQSRRGFK